MTTLPASGSGRETRLLLLVIVVAVAALLLLARFRFPGSDRVVLAPSSSPIDRLAARATFDDLARIIADVSTHVQSSLVSVTLERVPVPAATRDQRPAGARDLRVAEVDDVRLMPGVRTAPDMALVHVPKGYQLRAAAGVEIVLRDAERMLAVVRTPAASASIEGAVVAADPPAVPGYVAVAEGGRAGASLRPVFLGRLDAVADPRWTPAPIAIGGAAQIAPGSFVFTLHGRLIGMAVDDAGGMMIIPTAALESAVAAMTAAGGGGTGRLPGPPKG